MEKTTLNSAKEVVMSFINALNNDDFTTARTFTRHDLQFEGVMGSRDGADAYFNDMQKMRLKYDVKKVFVEGNDVCMFYDIDMSGKTIFSCGWYKVQDGKIASFRVIFDPRPLLS
jgi:limonene-1,2-epoxide hydrolase